MEIIFHRRNTIKESGNADRNFDVEVDLRSDLNSIYLHHSPFCAAEKFTDWLAHYQHGTLILNVQEEGLEGP